MGRKGQALIEFVIILPVFLLILFGIFDFFNIIYQKNILENKTSDIVKMLKKEKSVSEIEKFINEDSNYYINLKVKNEDDKTIIFIDSSIDLIMPGINIVLNDPYEISIKRVIYDE